MLRHTRFPPPEIPGRTNGEIIVSLNIACVQTSAAWLAQLVERRSAEWEVTGSNPGQTNTQGL